MQAAALVAEFLGLQAVDVGEANAVDDDAEAGRDLADEGDLAHGAAGGPGVAFQREVVRDGAAIADASGAPLGTITSGGFGPTVDRPIAMGYVPTAQATDGTALTVAVRERKIASKVARLPFVAHRYHKS